MADLQAASSGGTKNWPASRFKAVRWHGRVYNERIRVAGAVLLHELQALGWAGTLQVNTLTLRLMATLADSLSSYRLA